MKTNTRDKRLTRSQLRKARAELAGYRAWMDRVRLTDVANELAELEQMSIKRADLIANQVNPLAPHPGDARWEALRRRELALAGQFAFLREKIGWVLEP